MTLGVGSTKTGADSSGNQIVRQTGNIAVKGSEDLGGGLKANFEVQTAIGAHAATALNVSGAAASATTLGDRGLYANLQGGFGTVQVGRANSAVRSLWGAIGDVSQLAVVSGLSAGAGASGDAGARVIYGDAYSNYVAYATPSFNGFSASVAQAQVDNGTTPSARGDALSYSLQYANGPLTVGYNLTDSKQTAAATSTASTEAYKMHTLLASYDFGVAKIGYTNQSIKLASGTNPGDANALTVSVPMGAGNIGFGTGKRSAAGQSNLSFGDNVKQNFVGYRYNLSKRTNVQVVYNKIDREGATVTNDVKETHVLLAHTF